MIHPRVERERADAGNVDIAMARRNMNCGNVQSAASREHVGDAL